MFFYILFIIIRYAVDVEYPLIGCLERVIVVEVGLCLFLLNLAKPFFKRSIFKVRLVSFAFNVNGPYLVKNLPELLKTYDTVVCLRC